jgi:hypothetical protein
MAELSAFTSLEKSVLNTLVNDAYTYKEFLLLLNEKCPEFQRRLRGGQIKEVSFIEQITKVTYF